MSIPDCKIMLMDSMGPITDKIWLINIPGLIENGIIGSMPKAS